MHTALCNDSLLLLKATPTMPANVESESVIIILDWRVCLRIAATLHELAFLTHCL